jgi:hypothetical protein
MSGQHHASPTDLAGPGGAAARIAGPETTVVTRVELPMSPVQVWERLLYYEQVEERPGWLLSLLLPRPIGTEGRKSEVGDEARCLYESGHLVKRVTRVDPGCHCSFEVVEQSLPLRTGIRLSGGCYRLRDLGGGGTEVQLETRYANLLRPRWLWRPFEAAVCHAFHRHILAAMRRKLPRATPADRPRDQGPKG